MNNRAKITVDYYIYIFSADLLVLGCNVFGKTIEDIGRVFQYIGPVLNISTETTIKKVSPVEASLHVLRAAPRYCVLVVDAATVQDAYEQLGRRAEYEDLLKTAANTVGKMVILHLTSLD